jgi:predicted transcriptional regulator
VAQILGISEKSVEFYMESVKRKLEAANRTQAVVKALLLGLIDVDHQEASLAEKRSKASAGMEELTAAMS